MKLNTINLSNGSRFFIVEDFFNAEQYKDIVNLFNQYTPENQDWFEDPAYSHLYRGRMVYRGNDTTIEQLKTLAASPEIVNWISTTIGKELEFLNLDLWLDLPGYQVPPHYDQPHFEHAIQIYVPDPTNYWEMLGTCVYADDHPRKPLFEMHYNPNHGYLIDRTDTVKHGINHHIPSQYRRQSVYMRYKLK